MKAVVVEIKGNVAAVLSDDGCISKVKNKKYTLGQEIIIRNNKYIKLAASAAACLMLFVTPAWAYLTPYSYVSIDVNPSFEFSINRFDRVLQVKAINDDGQKVAEQIDINQLKNKEINEAVKNVLTELKDQGYLSNAKEDGVVVAASSKTQEKTDKLATGLKLAVEEIKIEQDKGKDVITVSEVEPTEQKDNQAEDKKEDKEIEEAQKEQVKSEKEQEKEQEKEEKEASEDNKESERKVKESEKDIRKAEKEQDKKDKKSESSDFEIQVIEVSQEAVNKAKDKGVTPGKMNLVEKLQLSAETAGKSIDAEKWLNKPVKDIMTEIKKYEELAKEAEKNNNRNNNNNKENEKKSENGKDDKSNNNKRSK